MSALVCVKIIRYTFKSMNNSNYMIKSLFNKTMFFALLTVFLSMQWSSGHIHLAEHHNHDGSHHQHEIEAHAHQSIAQDDNSSSSAYQVDNHSVNVVEIDYEYNTKSRNHLDDQFIASIPYDFHLGSLTLKSSMEPTKLDRSKLRYIQYSTIYGRAPPEIS